MAENVFDARGLKCPQPTLKLTVLAIKMKAGDTMELIADCPTFEKDVREWCTRSKKVLLWIKEEGSARRCRIQF